MRLAPLALGLQLARPLEQLCDADVPHAVRREERNAEIEAPDEAQDVAEGVIPHLKVAAPAEADNAVWYRDVEVDLTHRLAQEEHCQHRPVELCRYWDDSGKWLKVVRVAAVRVLLERRVGDGLQRATNMAQQNVFMSADATHAYNSAACTKHDTRMCSFVPTHARACSSLLTHMRLQVASNTHAFAGR